MTNAVVSLLYNVNYLPGAIILGVAAKKLIQLTHQPTVLALLIEKNSFNQHQLRLLDEVYDELIEVQALTSSLSDKLAHDLGRPELDKTFTKIHLWSLFDKFEKVLYLDVDTLPNIPEPSSPNQGSVLDLLKLEFPQHKILAAPDSGFPDVFNSGVFALKPNYDDYANLLALVRSQTEDISFDGADQGLLNQYFNSQPDWVADVLRAGASHVSEAASTKASNWVPVPFMYNTTPSAQYEYLPAYKYFAQPVGPSSEAHREYGPVDESAYKQGTDYTESFSKQLGPTYGTLERYHSTALNYYDGPDTQIKLLHYIGPFKPWFSPSKEGIFTNWWKLWDATFAGKSIEDVVFDRSDSVLSRFSEHSVDVLDSLKPEVEDKTPASIHDQEAQDLVVQPSSLVPPHITDPVELCDPKNYEHIPNIGPSSADSSWDATKEPPPKASPTPTPVVEEIITDEVVEPEAMEDPSKIEHLHHELDSSLKDRIPQFVSVWDQQDRENNVEPKTPPPATPKARKHLSEPPAVAHTSEPPFYSPDLQQQSTAKVSQLGSDVGYFKSQKPERVFDDESEYIPTHLLMPLSKPGGDSSAAAVDNSAEANPIDSLSKDTISFNRVNEELEKLGIDVEPHPSEEADEEDQFVDPELQYVPKLFPWEFERGVKPERVFY